MSDITIRNATLADAPRILEIYAWYVEHTVITFEYDVPSLEEFEGRMRRTMQKSPSLVMERGASARDAFRMVISCIKTSPCSNKYPGIRSDYSTAHFKRTAQSSRSAAPHRRTGEKCYWQSGRKCGVPARKSPQKRENRPCRRKMLYFAALL